MSPNDADGMANSIDPDQTLGAIWSWSALFAQAYLSENLGTLRYSEYMAHQFIKSYGPLFVKNNYKYRSNFGEVDVAPAKNDKVKKVEKWQKLTAGLNPNHMHIFRPWKKDVQSCIKTGMKLCKELRLQGNHCLYTFIESEVRKWQSSQSEKSYKN